MVYTAVLFKEANSFFASVWLAKENNSKTKIKGTYSLL